MIDVIEQNCHRSIGIPEHVVIPEAKDTKAATPQPTIAPTVRRAIIVLTAIDFDDEPFGIGKKVCNKRPDRYLSAELGAVERWLSQNRPELSLGGRRGQAKIAGKGGLLGDGSF